MQQSYYYQQQSQFPQQGQAPKPLAGSIRPLPPRSAVVPPNPTQPEYAGRTNPYTRITYPQQSNYSSLPVRSAWPVTGATDVPQLSMSPSTSWTDTPRTLYKMTPETENGDDDLEVIESGSEEDDWDPNTYTVNGVRVRTKSAASDDACGMDKDRSSRLDAPAPSAFSNLMSPPNASYTLGDLEEKVQNGQVDPSQMRMWNTRLHQDIRNATLFPSPNPLASLALQQPTQTARTAPATYPNQHPDVMAPGAAVRQSSMHLPAASRPINPFARLPARPATPIQPYPAITVPTKFLRAFQDTSVGATMDPKESFLAGALWAPQHDPNVMAGLMELPPEALQFIVDCGAQGESTESTPTTPAFSVAPVEEERKPRRVGTRAGVKRRRSEAVEDESEYQGSDDDEDAAGDDDDDYKAPASARISEPAAKRSRSSVAESSSTLSAPPMAPPAQPAGPSTVIPPRRTPYQTVTKQRTRHLQPHINRSNGCLHGCPLLFSTPYEARRHQEDAHGREEATAIKQLYETSPHEMIMYPRECRFIVQIGLHSSEKWNTAMKAAFTNAMKKEDEPLPAECMAALLAFSIEWSKRYECPKCGTSFSRLDSKKRHYEKQCR